MALPGALVRKLEIPVIGAPMLTPASKAMAIEQCKSGIIGAFPALAARPQAQFEVWLDEIEEELGAFRAINPDKIVAPHAVNLIVHKTNTRHEADLEICLKHKVPVILTSTGPRADIVKEVRRYGGILFHDVISMRHAEKAMAEGVDGLILVCAGAGGLGGTLNPFAFVNEIREVFDGTIILAGAMSTGRDVLAAQVMGADMAILGTSFIASVEANTDQRYRDMLVACAANDIIFTPYFSGAHCNWMKPSIREMGIDPDDPKLLTKPEMREDDIRRYTDVLCAGQGVGSIKAIEPAAVIVERLKTQYRAALAELRRSAGSMLAVA
jgi:nitronate monooxygenase